MVNITTLDYKAHTGIQGRGYNKASTSRTSGVLKSYRGGLSVVKSTVAPANVQIGTGGLFVDGAFIENTSVLDVETFVDGIYKLICRVDVSAGVAQFMITDEALNDDNLTSTNNGIHDYVLAEVTRTGSIITNIDILYTYLIEDMELWIKSNYFDKNEQNNKFVKLAGDDMTGNLSTKELTVTKLTNTGITTLNELVTAQKNLTVNQAFTANGPSFMKSIITRGENISTQGAEMISNKFTLHKPDGSGNMGFLVYKDATSGEFLKDMYTKAINTQGNPINLFGGEILGNKFSLQKTDGFGSIPFISYRDASSANVVKDMYTKAIDTQGSKISTSNGNAELGTGNLLSSGRIYLDNTNYEQIVLENASGVSGTKTIKLRHNVGATAGLLSWDRSTNGQNACYFNQIALQTGLPYVGLRMVENQRVYNYATAKFLTESATLFATQVSNLEINISLQDQIDIMSNVQQSILSRLDLLEQQVSALINGTSVPTTLRTASRTSTVNLSISDDLRQQLNDANEALTEQNFQDEITLIDDTINILTNDLKEINLNASRTASTNNKLSTLYKFKEDRARLLNEYGRDADGTIN